MTILCLFTHYSKIGLAWQAIIFFIVFLSYVPNAKSQSWLWAKGANGSGFASITTDAFGHVYTAGAFSSPTITFGGITLTNTNTGTDSAEDIFLVKYDTSGNVIWAKSAGGIGFAAATSITTDREGNVYITGANLSYHLTFDTITIDHSANDDNDMFVAKYDSSGNALWAKGAGSSGFSGDIGALSVMSDAIGNVYVAGTFGSSTVTFGSTTLVDSGGYDMFLAKYTPSGNVIWAKAAQSGLYNVSAAIDTMDHVYVTGSFGGYISFGDSSLTGVGGYSIFLAKYDSSGNVIWANSVNSVNAIYTDYVSDIATDIAGNVYITGYFNGPSLAVGTTSLTNDYLSVYDNFTAKYDSSGRAIWAKNAVSPGNSDFGAVTADNLGNVYTAGAYEGPSIAFGHGTLNNPNSGSYAIFVTKYDSSGNDMWAISANGIASIAAGSIAVNAPGEVYVTGAFFSHTFSMGATTLTGGNDFQYFLARLDTTYNPYAGILAVAGSSNSIYLCPNPNQGSFTLNISSSQNEDAAITITNILGEKVKQLTTTTNTDTQIQLNTSPGIYFISAITVSGEQTTKVEIW